MADSFKVTDGVTEIELIYAAGSQEEYKLQYGTRVSVPEPAVLVHQPDDGESQPIRAVDRDREVYLTMNVPGDDWDAVIDAVTRLKRMVDGAHSQALRYWTIGDVDRVVLRVQKDGSANYTDLLIKWGFVDDSTAYHTSIQTEIGWQIVVMLVVAPYGEGAPIALRNDLASSPHFIEDSNSDGLADGWTIIGGSGALNTTYYLVGGQSQELTVTSSGTQYINSDTVTASTSSDGVGYIWICEPTGTADPVTIRLLNGSNGTISFETFDPAAPADYDKTAIGAAGETWYRYSVTGNNGGTSGLRIQVIRGSGDASAAGTYYLDAAYLEVDASVVPEAWCSASTIKYHYDDEAGELNYIDIWAVPGDAPAMLDQFLDVVSVSAANPTLVMSAYRQYTNAGDRLLFVDSDHLSAALGGSGGSTQSSAAAVHGDFLRTPSGVASSALSLTLDGSTAAADIVRFKQLHRADYRFFGLVKYNNTGTATFKKSSQSQAYNGYFECEPATLYASTSWQLVDMGYFKTGGTVEDYDFGGNLVWYVDQSAAGTQVDIDGIFCIPVEEYLSFIGDGAPAGTDELYIKHKERKYFKILTPTSGYIGNPFIEIPPGQDVTRVAYLSFDRELKSTSIDDSIVVEYTITPRTRHLLGAI
jgi:hypothetical protein